jgi:predicted transcriptional regulator
MVDMLRVINENGITKPTHILYKANLSHKLLKGYLEVLVANEFVEEVNKGNNICYTITEKGQKLISQFKQMEKIATGFGLTV